jgi:hypothetical protein
MENILNSGSPNALGSLETSGKADGGGARPAVAENRGHDKQCRIGGKLTLDDFAETSEVGDWKMPDFKAACIRRFPGLADRWGQCVDVDDGGVGGGVEEVAEN